MKDAAKHPSGPYAAMLLGVQTASDAIDMARTIWDAACEWQSKQQAHTCTVFVGQCPVCGKTPEKAK